MASSKLHFFLTGTDTAVGKTFFATWLVRQWRAQQKSAVGLKPISCGNRADAEVLRLAGENALSLDEINPVFYKTAASPYSAAQQENRVVDLQKINATVQMQLLKFTHVVVEGAGGWLVPLAREMTVREWAWQLGLPVIVVARAGLGTLNHTLLTVESIRQTGLECLGVVLNAGAPEIVVSDPVVLDTNPKIIEEFTGLGVFRFERGANPNTMLPAWLRGES
jgi:dethiobiotin synthetase